METAEPVAASVLTSINRQLDFHGRWKSVTMITYAVTSVGMRACSAAAILFAALNHGLTAAVLSAITTVLAGTEKTLLFREKWKLHLGVYTAYQNLELDVRAGAVDVNEALVQMKRIAEAYAADLPIETRVS